MRTKGFVARVGLVLLAFYCVSAMAQTWPAKPIRVIVPFAPGGAVDMTARIIGQPLSERLKQQIVVENRGGAGGNIGVTAVARAAPDGYTLAMATAGQIAINPHLYKTMPFDPLKDLVPIAPAGKAVNVLNVHPSVPATSIKQLVALARAQPNKLNYATGGLGASAHTATELFMSMTGTKMVHVPYKGGGPATVALLAGEADLSFSTVGTVIQHIRAKQLRALGVTSLERFELLPDVPTISEAGVRGYESVAFYGLFAPTGTPPDVVKRLSADVAAVLQTETVRRRLIESGVLPFSSSQEAFAAYVASEHQKWGKLIRDNRITIE